MNAKRGLNAMNGNNVRLSGLILALLLLCPPLQAAEAAPGADKTGNLVVKDVEDDPSQPPPEKPKPQMDYLAPTLYGLREVLIPYPVFIEPRASNDCGLNRETLLTVMQRNLQDPNLEIMPLDEAHERQSTRATLAYEIHTSKVDQTCLSWINMHFTDRTIVTLAPLKVPKALTITYWQKSSLARSPSDRHQTAVGDSLAAMGRQFLREVKLAEPATYSADSKKLEASEEELKSEKQMELLRSLNDSVAKRLINNGAGGADIMMPGTKQPASEER